MLLLLEPFFLLFLFVPIPSTPFLVLLLVERPF